MRFLLTAAFLCALSGAASAHDVPLCYDPETAALRSVSEAELVNHGGSPLGPVDYPAGTLHRNFSFAISFVIDVDGRISCISTAERGFMSVDVTDAELTPQRQALLDALSAQRFTPFTDVNGRPEKVVVNSLIDEQELPYRHVAPPPGDLASTVIKLVTSGHRSPEHGYAMTVLGSGDAAFEAWGQKTPYRIPPERVAAMVDLANEADFWSLKDVYLPQINPETPWAYSENGGYYRKVTITRGGLTKSVIVYDWDTSSAPLPARDLMERMALTGGLDLFPYWGVTSDTIALKVYNNFDFATPSGGELLIEVTSRQPKFGGLSDSEVYGLIARGAPMNLVRQLDLDTGFLDAAIDGHRWELAHNLIAQGALLTDEKPDATKVNRALAHAVAAPSREFVGILLAFQPKLTVRHTVDDNDGNRRETDPIVTYVGRYSESWQGDEPEPTDDLIAITQSLLSVGANLNSRDFAGDNVLVHAIRNGQAGFARWLIQQGVTPQRADGTWPYFDSWRPNEASILVLLDAGAANDLDALGHIINWARAGDEPSVEAWLRAHGKWVEE